MINLKAILFCAQYRMRNDLTETRTFCLKLVISYGQMTNALVDFSDFNRDL